MEIKVGDKVRVSKDAPEMYFFGCNHDNSVYEVILVDRDNAEITQIKNGSFAIPTKYLIKVDAEAKEAKFKKGDRVKFKNIYELQKVKAASFHWMLSMFASKEATVTAVEDNGFYRVDIDPSIGGINDDMIESKVEPTAPTIKVGDMVRCKSPLRLKSSTDDDFVGTVTDAESGWFRVRMNNGAIFQSYNAADLELVQPKEQAEAEKTDTDNIVDNFAKVMEGYRKVFADIADNFDWQRYEADLAKEIALKVANKYMDGNPEEIGAYAVSVAKAVVEGLKRK